MASIALDPLGRFRPIRVFPWSPKEFRLNLVCGSWPFSQAAHIASSIPLTNLCRYNCRQCTTSFL